MKKRCVSAFLALAMALSLAVPALAAQAQYADVSPDSWYYPAVNYVTQHGLMVGVGDNRFDPDGNTQRGALMTMLARFDGADLPATTPWYQAGMDWAMEEGISDGSDPEGNITRVQTVTMMWRLLGEPVVSADLSAYSDADQIPSWGLDAIRWAVDARIMQGSDGQLNPNSIASRAEIAQLMMQFADGVKG